MPSSLLGRDVYSHRCVAPGNAAGEFLVTSQQSYNRGLILPKAGLDGDGRLGSGETAVTTIPMSSRDALPIYNGTFKLMI